MKSNYKLTVAYDGSRYYGWEHQPQEELTIQGKLENVLAKMTDSDIPEVIGAGRTDAGVHALGMVCNVWLETELATDGIKDYMNRYLPDDICIKDVRIASERFHSRYNATGKTYRYTCYVGPDKPLFMRKYVFAPEEMPDVDRLRAAAAHLTGTHDFKSFCGNPRMKKSTVREIYSIDIEQKNDYLTFTYHGSGFLQYMVRILTGTLLEAGCGKREPESMEELIAARDRSLAGPTAPAKGLCLLRVDY